MQESIPTISVIMPVYNAEKYLAIAIDSILNQTFQDFELIIIDDASTDDSLNIIYRFSQKDSRIKLIKNNENQGISNTLNKGIELSKGGFIARMDADDIALPQRFEKQIKFLNMYPESAGVFAWIELIDEHNQKIGVWEADRLNNTHQEIKNYLSKGNCLAHPTAMFRQYILKKNNYSKVNWNGQEDYFLWLNLSQQDYILSKIPEVLLQYRKHSQAVTNCFYFKTQNPDYQVRKIFLKQNLGKYFFSFFYWRVFFQFLVNYYRINLNPSLQILNYRVKKIYFLFFLFSKPEWWKFLLKWFFSNKEGHLYLFFPRYCIGGAEKVHLEIVKALKPQKTIIFFTRLPDLGTGLKKEFEANVTIFFDIGKILTISYAKDWVIKLIIRRLKRDKNPIVFGALSIFFYDLLNYIPTNTKAIDLIHSLGGEIEDYSQNKISFLNVRLTLNEMVKNQLIKHSYQDPKLKIYQDRIKLIPLYKEEDIDYHKDKKKDKNFTVIYVGRDGAEKRLYLIDKIAEKSQELAINVDFILVGNIKSISEKNCKIISEISDYQLLKDIYQESDVFLLLSEREGLPLSLCEAMLNGLVPICTNVGAISSIIKHSENGFLIDDIENQEVIIEKVIEYLIFLRANPEILHRISYQAYIDIITTFPSKEDFKSQLKNLINSINKI